MTVEGLLLRLARGETLEGKDARVLLVATEEAPWQLWVYVAIGYMELGRYDDAYYVLDQLINRQGGSPEEWMP